MRVDDALEPHEFEFGGYGIRIYPPAQSAIGRADIDVYSPVPLLDVVRQLGPKDPQDRSEAVKMDGSQTVRADLLQIDFVKADFDRRKPVEAPKTQEQHRAFGDPSIDFAFKVANDFLGRIRIVGDAAHVRPVSPDELVWGLVYLNDDESEPAVDPTLVRRRYAGQMQWKLSGVNQAVWETAGGLPAEYVPPGWAMLLLDAEAKLPEVGPSIVLAHTALETFIAWSLDELAVRSGLPPDLWTWIKERDYWLKEPSTGEQFDVLLRVLGGKSLKEEPNLWEVFRNLQEARHSFAHEGRARIGGVEVSPKRAGILVGRAKEIVQWVELLLPPELRRRVFRGTVVWNVMKPLKDG